MMAVRLPSKPPKNPPSGPSLAESERLMPSASVVTSSVLQELRRLIRRTPALEKRVAALRTKVLRLQGRVDTLLIPGQDKLAVTSPTSDVESDLPQAEFAETSGERSEADRCSWSDLRTKIHEVVMGAYRLVQEIQKTSGETNNAQWDSVVLTPFDDVVLHFGRLSLGNRVAKNLRGTVRRLDSMLLDLLGGGAKRSE